MYRLLFAFNKYLTNSLAICLIIFICNPASSGNNNELTLSESNNKDTRSLHIELLLEGLFDEATGQLRQAHDFGKDGPIPAFSDGIADIITISLHKTADYSEYKWGEKVVFETTANLSQTGQAVLEIPDVSNGYELNETYWLSVNHRNHLETVYQEPLDFGQPGPYFADFKRGNQTENPAVANNQAYKGSIQENDETVHLWAIYAGDLNGDGYINLTDRSLLLSKLFLGLRGYIPEDIDGDGIVSILDRTLLNKNILKQVKSKNPETESVK